MEDLPRTNEAEIESELRKAHKFLSDTDYIIIKMKEYEITGQEISEDYSEILEKREEARNVIRNLKNQ